MDSADLANPDPSNIDPSTMDPRLLCYLDSPQRTFELCGVEGSGWGYRPSHGTNLAFAVLFGLSLAMFLIQGLVHRRYWGFTIAMACGCTLEIIGYIARAQAHRYLWSEVYYAFELLLYTSGLTLFRTCFSSRSCASPLAPPSWPQASTSVSPTLLPSSDLKIHASSHAHTL